MACSMETNKLIATRRHEILDARFDQLRVNMLAFAGGQPYIEERLCRYPSESDTDFTGDSSSGSNQAIGRKQRAFVINYVRRIAHKINQYVFKTEISREGADPAFLLDATATGTPMNQLMSELSSLVSVCRWGWLGIDRPSAPVGRSVAQRQASGDRVYWQLYSPSEVVDWNFSTGGKLNWAMTERTIYDNSDPFKEAVNTRVRYLHQPGVITKYTLKDNTYTASEDVLTGLDEVNLICCGIPSSTPWWMDEVELIQRIIMDLLSSRDTQIFKAVFALLIISDSFASGVKTDGMSASEARAKIGIGNPISETAEESGITRYLTAPAEVFNIIGAAKVDCEKSMYDIVGLAMSSPDSRQVESAEAKAWKHLDPEAVLKERASMLEEAEAKGVEMSSRLGGPIFKPYVPIYGKSFDISDFAQDMASVTEAGAMNLPPTAEKLLQKVAMRAVGKRFEITKEELKTVLAEIDAYDPIQPIDEFSSRARGGIERANGDTATRNNAADEEE